MGCHHLNFSSSPHFHYRRCLPQISRYLFYIIAVKQLAELLVLHTIEHPRTMPRVTFSFLFLLFTLFTKLCGASVDPLQNPFNDRPATVSESVHEALVNAAIIPDGIYIFSFLYSCITPRKDRIYISPDLKPCYGVHFPPCVFSQWTFLT